MYPVDDHFFATGMLDTYIIVLYDRLNRTLFRKPCVMHERNLCGAAKDAWILAYLLVYRRKATCWPEPPGLVFMVSKPS